MTMDHEHTWEERTLPIPKRVEYRFCPWCGTVQVKLGGGEYVTVLDLDPVIPVMAAGGRSLVNG